MSFNNNCNNFIESKQFSCPTIGHLSNDQILKNDNNNNNNNNKETMDITSQWRFSYPLDVNNNNNNNNNNLNKPLKINKLKYWKNGVIPLNNNSFKSCPNLLNSYSKNNNSLSNLSSSSSNNGNSIKLDDLLEPRPNRRNTKIEEMVKGRIKEKIGKLLNNELMEKQGKAIGKAASTYEDNILKSKERAKKYIMLSQSNSFVFTTGSREVKSY